MTVNGRPSFHTLFLSFSIFIALGSPSRASASEETAIQVAQPIWTENGIVVSSVTFIRWLGSPEPGIEVACTANPNHIEREGDARPSNRNAAALYGIAVRTNTKSKWKDWPREFADTLGVVMDLSGIGQRDSSKLVSEEQVVKATVECILTNASRSRPAIKFIALEVLGAHKFRSLSKVYRVGRASVVGSKRAAGGG